MTSVSRRKRSKNRANRELRQRAREHRPSDIPSSVKVARTNRAKLRRQFVRGRISAGEFLAFCDIEQSESWALKEAHETRKKLKRLGPLTFSVIVEVTKLRDYLTSTGYVTPSGAWVPPMTRTDSAWLQDRPSNVHVS